jgi:hypothetical protein
MPSKKLPVVLVALLLKATSSLAQTPAAPKAAPRPEPDYQEVRVPVPRAVTLLTDVASALLSRSSEKSKVQDLLDRRRARSLKGEQSLVITVPKNKFTQTVGLVE